MRQWLEDEGMNDPDFTEQFYFYLNALEDAFIPIEQKLRKRAVAKAGAKKSGTKSQKFRKKA